MMNLLRALSIPRVMNYIKLHLSYWYSILRKRPCHAGMPASLSVEPTTSCNLRCPQCPSGLRQFTRPQGKMEPAKFRSWLDQFSRHLMYLIIYFQGEPLLNPDFFDLVRYARSKRIYTATSTNGHQLDDAHARKLVESGLDRLIVSIDGTDQETYGHYRRGGRLETVKDGVKRVVGWKNKLGSARPFVIIQFLVFRKNEHQIPEMKRLCRELGADKLELKTAQVYDFEQDTGFIPDNPRYSRYIRGEDGLWKHKRPVRNRCFRMWSGAVITWDGRVVPCCFDKDAEHQMGSLEEQGFHEIWRSGSYQKFREQILIDRSTIDICRNCTE